MSTVLIVDDEKHIRDSLEGVLGDEGYGVVTAEDADDALKRFDALMPDLVLLDIWMPGTDGIDALKEMKLRYPQIPVIMVSGHGTVETAVRATKLGAYDFLEKPLSLEKVILTIGHALEQKRLTEENRALREGEKKKYVMIGESAMMDSLKEDISKVAGTDSWILITGENGTGKELVARNIHLSSKRSGKPFIAINCAAIPEELIESELFGYEKGAFTGAASKKKGRFDLADGGTIFLDEIGDMSLKTQAKVLRILEGQSFERVGGTVKITVDVRVIAATNKDLGEEIKQGHFREDLYYRLNVIPFHISPLRERASDIPLFTKHFLKEFSGASEGSVRTLSSGALQRLKEYSWPGNVRELRNLMERLVIMTSTGEITEDGLPQYIRGNADTAGGKLFSGTFKDARSNFEKEFIVKKLSEHDGNIAKTAEAIGLERSHLYRKIKAYNIR